MIESELIRHKIGTINRDKAIQYLKQAIRALQEEEEESCIDLASSCAWYNASLAIRRLETIFKAYGLEHRQVADLPALEA
jgi:hypothetical protein